MDRERERETQTEKDRAKKNGDTKKRAQME